MEPLFLRIPLVLAMVQKFFVRATLDVCLYHFLPEIHKPISTFIIKQMSLKYLGPHKKQNKTNRNCPSRLSPNDPLTPQESHDPLILWQMCGVFMA